MRRLKNAWHNLVIHPIAGVCWLFGFEKLGDRIHGCVAIAILLCASLASATEQLAPHQFVAGAAAVESLSKPTPIGQFASVDEALKVAEGRIDEFTRTWWFTSGGYMCGSSANSAEVLSVCRAVGPRTRVSCFFVIKAESGFLLYGWHKEVAQRPSEEEDLDAAGAWAYEKGKSVSATGFIHAPRRSRSESKVESQGFEPR